MYVLISQISDPNVPNNDESSSKKRKGDKINAPITRVRFSATILPSVSFIKVKYELFFKFRYRNLP